MGAPAIGYHWLYRDFLTAAHTASPVDWTDRVWQDYVGRHEALLNRLYFRPKGVKDPRGRLTALGPGRFGPLLAQIGDPTAFEEDVRTLWGDVLARLHYHGPSYEVFVVVGLDVTNIYSLTMDGHPVAVLCVEAVDADRAGLRRLIAHESHHWARQAGLGHNPSVVGERLVSEGLAAVFSEEVQPGLSPAAYCYVDAGTVAWVGQHRHLLQQWLSQLDSGCLMDALFSRTYDGPPLTAEMPRRTGYVYGYFACQAALDCDGRRLSAVDRVDVSWQAVLSREGTPPGTQ
jgi:hypothetical protein